MATVTWTPTNCPGGASATVAATQNGSLSISDSYQFLNTGKTILSCDKGTGSATATVVTPATVRGSAIADSTYTLAASTEDQILGPFPPDIYNDASGYCTISFSDIAGLTVTVLQLP